MRVKEAAEILGYSTVHVCHLAAAGSLKAHKVRKPGYRSDVWEIDEDSVAEYRHPRRGGNMRESWAHRSPIDAGPLLTEIARRGGRRACKVKKGSNNERALDRATETGRLTLRMADRLCIEVLGLTMDEVYGYDDVEELADDEEVLVEYHLTG